MGDEYYHHYGRKRRKRQSNPIQVAFVLILLTGAIALAFMVALGCQAAPGPLPKQPELPASVSPAVSQNATALDRAGEAIKTIPAQADAASLAAPAVKPQAEAIKAAASVAGAAVGDAKAHSATVAAGIDDRDRALSAQKYLLNEQAKALKTETVRADKAEKALEDRAKDRIEWLLTLGGFALIAISLGLAYMLFQAGSVVRALGVISAGVVLGSACFTAAVYLDTILTVGCWALGAAALIGLVVAALHYRKHFKKAQVK